MFKNIFIVGISAVLPFLAVGKAEATPVYLNDQNISVSLGSSHGTTNPFTNTTIAVGLENVIDAASAGTIENHNQASHVWTSNIPLELDFDFGIEYDLTSLHFWNYHTEGYDVDQIDFSFFDATMASVGTLSFAPTIGTGINQTAQDYALSFPNKVQFVNAILTGSNGEVDFNNLGFTGSVTPPPATVPLPASLILLLSGIVGLRFARFTRRPAKLTAA